MKTSSSGNSAPVTVSPDAVPRKQRTVWGLDPVLAIFDSPLTVHGSPRRGKWILLLASILVAGEMAWYVSQVLLPGEELADPFMLLVMVVPTFVVVMYGKSMSQGWVVHSPAKTRLAWTASEGPGSRESAAHIHSALQSRSAGPTPMVVQGRAGSHEGAVHTRVYRSAKAATAWATVHFVSHRGDVTAWPPVELAAEQASALPG